MTLAQSILAHENKEKAQLLGRFFKTGKGEYAYGDRFVGLTVPQTRSIAKKYYQLSLNEIRQALQSPFHEVRLASLYVLVYQFTHGNEQKKKELCNFYVKYTPFINNWDLVDTSVYFIVGEYIFGCNGDVSILRRLVVSENLWERRMAMVACFAEIRRKEYLVTFEMARTLLTDSHDLIHKAVGWMLREVGKRCGERILRGFLDEYATSMPRTALRYAIERLDPLVRKKYLSMKKMV